MNMNSAVDETNPEPPKQTARKSRPPLAKSVKLNAELVVLAELESDVAQRSTPRQIEYWSLLGRVVERYLRKDQVHALITEQKSITEITLGDIFPTADVVMAELEERRVSGELSTSVTTAAEVYDVVEGQEGLIRKRTADGTEVCGKWDDSGFVEHR